MSAKRKGGVPKKVEAAKRQLLSWNMRDVEHGVVVVADSDPSLQLEELAALAGGFHALTAGVSSAQQPEGGPHESPTAGVSSAQQSPTAGVSSAQQPEGGPHESPTAGVSSAQQPEGGPHESPTAGVSSAQQPEGGPHESPTAGVSSAQQPEGGPHESPTAGVSSAQQPEGGPHESLTAGVSSAQQLEGGPHESLTAGVSSAQQPEGGPHESLTAGVSSAQQPEGGPHESLTAGVSSAQQLEGGPHKSPTAGVSSAQQPEGGPHESLTAGVSSAQQLEGGPHKSPTAGVSSAQQLEGGPHESPMAGVSSAQQPEGGPHESPMAGVGSAQQLEGGPHESPTAGVSSAQQLEGGSHESPPTGGTSAQRTSLDPTGESDLEELVCQSRVCLSVKTKLGLAPDAWSCRLGAFRLNLTQADHLFSDTEGAQLKLHVNKNPAKHVLQLRRIEGATSNGDGITVLRFRASTDVSYAVLEALQWKALICRSSGYCSRSRTLEVSVHVTDSALTTLRFASEGVKPKRCNKALQTLMTHFYTIDATGVGEGVANGRKKHDTEELYRANKAYHQQHPAGGASGAITVQHPCLVPRLREYQRQAVLWMLSKENQTKQHIDKQPAEVLHQLYEEVTTADAQLLYYNRHAGYLVKEKPLRMSSAPGGILADEMGLGKTVEVLACMLCHPRKGFPKPVPLPAISPYQMISELKNESASDGPGSTIGSVDGHVHVPYRHSDHGHHGNAPEDKTPSGVKQGCGGGSDEGPLLGKMVDAGELPSDQQNEVVSHDHSYFAPTEVASPSGDSEGSHDADLSLEQRLAPAVAHDGGDDDNDGDVSDCKCPLVVPSPTGSLGISCAAAMMAEGAVEFGCVCGRSVGEPEGTVQCQQCGVWQHARCLNYDLGLPDRGPYLCPHCLVAAPPVESGATLIISPSSICHQWVEEVNKHIKSSSLKLLVYTGVQKQGFVQPQTLSSQDIVITTYETLRREIDHVDVPHTNGGGPRRLRHPKRFMAVPSPMTAVQWWRVCLDEAQMVECTTTKTAEMALRLNAVNKWCVTGTPIQRGIEDLYGLLLFLGLDPFWVQFWWNKLLYHPYCSGYQGPLQQVLTRILWRTAKSDVLDQVNLPLQQEELHWLTFSPVEEHFYRQQYQQCAREALHKLSRCACTDVQLSSLDRFTVHELLYPLVRLRQACCHPQAVRGEFLPIRKSTLTMEQLLTQLIKKAQLECEECHRQYVFAMNGLAALHVIDDRHSEAIEAYREVLRSVEQHKAQLRTDELQQLHTLHNLHGVIAASVQAVVPTLRDSQLVQQADEIRQKYKARFLSKATAAEESWHSCRSSLQQLNKELQPGLEWWIELIQWAVYSGVDQQLVEKVKEDLSDNANPNVQTMSHRFRDARGLQYVVSSQLGQIDQVHGSLVECLQQLGSSPSTDEVNLTVNCCLRPLQETLKVCAFCKADVLFQDYECKLFSFVDKGFVGDVVDQESDAAGGYQLSTHRQGTWADSETERCLKALISFSRNWGGNRELADYGTLHVKVLDALKKEFKHLRSLWLALREHVSAIDELNMATTRIRVRLPDKPSTETPNIVEPAQVHEQRLRMDGERVLSSNKLKRKLGQLLYLKNMANAQTIQDDGENPTLCPVCQSQLGSKWSVLQCGHCYCLKCIGILVSRHPFGGRENWLKCPVCRGRTAHSDISYVSTKSAGAADEDKFDVRGDHSTKVEGVVNCLLKIQRDDPTAKALLFSTWQDVLDILSQALQDNDISFRCLGKHSKFQENLASFRLDPEVKVLLLPVHSGAKGLNLVEATHVLLVEPILNPAQELQAIGRVHRIGQTKATFVHRFLVRATIEERMYKLLQTATVPDNSNNTEETTITVRDFSSLFEEVADEDGGEGEGQEGQDDDDTVNASLRLR